MADDDLTPQRTAAMLGAALAERPVPMSFGPYDEHGHVDPTTAAIDLDALVQSFLNAIADAELRLVCMPIVDAPPEATWERMRALVTANLAGMGDEATAIAIGDPTPHLSLVLLGQLITLLLREHTNLIAVDALEFWRTWCAQPTTYDDEGGPA